MGLAWSFLVTRLYWSKNRSYTKPSLGNKKKPKEIPPPPNSSKTTKLLHLSKGDNLFGTDVPNATTGHSDKQIKYFIHRVLLQPKNLEEEVEQIEDFETEEIFTISINYEDSEAVKSVQGKLMEYKQLQFNKTHQPVLDRLLGRLLGSYNEYVRCLARITELIQPMRDEGLEFWTKLRFEMDEDAFSRVCFHPGRYFCTVLSSHISTIPDSGRMALDTLNELELKLTWLMQAETFQSKLTDAFIAECLKRNWKLQDTNGNEIPSFKLFMASFNHRGGTHVETLLKWEAHFAAAEMKVGTAMFSLMERDPPSILSEADNYWKIILETLSNSISRLLSDETSLETFFAEFPPYFVSSSSATSPVETDDVNLAQYSYLVKDVLTRPGAKSRTRLMLEMEQQIQSSSSSLTDHGMLEHIQNTEAHYEQQTSS